MVPEVWIVIIVLTILLIIAAIISVKWMNKF